MPKRNNKIHSKVIAIDFFSGCGCVTHGMKNAGIKVVAGLDNNNEVRFAYEENNKSAKFYNIDITEEKKTLALVKTILKEICWDILVFSACVPCQPFSQHKRNGYGDKRRNLLKEFMQIVEKLPKRMRPTFIFCENVSTMKGKGKDIIKSVCEQLDTMGYETLPHRIVNAADFGVPQNRKRLIFIAAQRKYVKKTEMFNWDYFYNNYKENQITVRDAIGNGRLPRIPAGLKENKKDPLHVACDLSAKNLKRIQQITRPGGSRDMWKQKDNLNCYKRHNGHTDVYGRMSWDKPSPTLTCRCISLSNGRFGHPEQDRAISLREAAILQTMDAYRFKKPIVLTKVAEQIGNAVPPKLAEKFGNFILEIIHDTVNEY